MELDAAGHARLVHISEHLENIDDRTRKLLALGEEQLDTQRRLVEAQDTQNLIAWLQYSLAAGKNTDQQIEAIVRDRLRL